MGLESDRNPQVRFEVSKGEGKKVRVRIGLRNKVKGLE